jgi:hypothetical protein
MTRLPLLLLATISAVAGASPGNLRMLQGSASSADGDTVTADDSLWTVRAEYDIIKEGGCMGSTPNFASATKGCDPTDETLWYCSVQLGSVSDSSIDTALTYYNATCSADPGATIAAVLGSHGSYLSIGFYLDDDCQVLDHANGYLLDDTCHARAEQDATGDWVGVSTKVTFDIENITASVLQFNSTDCSGESDILALNANHLSAGACVGRMKAQVGDIGADGNGGSSHSGTAVASVTLFVVGVALLIL